MNLSAVVEVERGEESEEVARMREGHPVTWSQRWVTASLTLLIVFGE